jgi:peptidoglycan/LPS O-acetylase OafA/YrhL
VTLDRLGPFSALKDVSDRFISHPFILFLAVVAVLAMPNELRGIYPALMLATLIPWFIVIGSTMQCDGLWQRHICLFLGWMSYPIYCLH